MLLMGSDVGLVHSRSDSGLSVMMSGADERAVARALRDHDDALRLVPQGSDSLGTTIYKVFRYHGSERPAEFVLGWWDDHGQPYPLSMALLEMVKRHDKNMRGHELYVDPDEHNRRLKEQRHKDADADAETIKEEMLKRHKSTPVFHRSPAFAESRRRARRKGRSYG